MRVALVMKRSVPEKQLDKSMPAGTDSPAQMQGHPSPPRASGRPHGHRHPTGSGSQSTAVLLPWGNLTKRAGWAPEVLPLTTQHQALAARASLRLFVPNGDKARSPANPAAFRLLLSC